jgi:hypothetical protein
LGPKGIPSTSSSGNNGRTARGVAGFLFYENKDGFHFRSIDTLVSATKTQISSTAKESIPKYNYNPGVIESENIESNFSILNYNFEKNIDLMKSLRVGMYANITYFYDLYENRIDGITYSLNSEIKSKLGGFVDFNTPHSLVIDHLEFFLDHTDVGILDKTGKTEDSGRDNTDMAKLFSL